jgi:hypothetical protein
MTRRRSVLLLGSFLVVLGLVNAPSAWAAAEGKLTVSPTPVAVGATASIELRMYWTYADGPRAAPDFPSDYRFSVIAVSPRGGKLPVTIRFAEPGIWRGSFRFGHPGRWRIRVLNFQANPGRYDPRNPGELVVVRAKFLPASTD